jgi:phosphoribosylformylglycinamidine synthase subunit PurS
MTYRAEVFVTLKPVVNDPAGLTIRGALHALGFDSVNDVRAGKYLVVTLEADDESQARARVEEMTRQLLANAVIEDARVELASPSPLAGSQIPSPSGAGPSAHASGASVPGERLRRSGQGGGLRA